MLYPAPGTEGSKVEVLGEYGNFIGGKFVAPIEGEYADNPTPVTGKPFVDVVLDAGGVAAQSDTLGEVVGLAFDRGGIARWRGVVVRRCAVLAALRPRTTPIEQETGGIDAKRGAFLLDG